MAESAFQMIEKKSEPQVARLVHPDPPRLRRIRFFSQLLDQSICLPGGYRIGFDPIIGLIPGIGDFLGALFSCYLVLEAYQLGIPKRLIFEMLINIGIEAIVGTVPVVGDVFDAVWKANMKNLRLVEAAYHPHLKERSAWRLMLGLILGLVIFWIGSIAFILLLVRWILSFF